RYLCDAGWGEGPMEPVPLRIGAHDQGPFRWTTEREPSDDGWWITQHEWGSTPGFRFGDDAVPLATYAPHHLRLATTAESNFVKTLVVQQPADDHVTTLRARTLTRKGPGRDEHAVLDDEDAFATTLKGVFGI